MNMRSALLVSCGLLAATPAFASIHDILIGLDAKVTYDANGPANGAPGKDAVLIMDVSNPGIAAVDELVAWTADELASHTGRQAGAGRQFRGE